MKKFVFFWILSQLIAGGLQAQYKTADSPALIAHSTQIQKMNVKLDTLQNKVDTIKSELLVSDRISNKYNSWGIFISLLPGILFIFLITIFYITLKGKFSLAEALTENAPTSITIQNAEYTTANISAIGVQPLLAPQIATILPPTIQISGTEKSKSSSRYLALITGFTGLIIAICMVMFYMYSYISNPDKQIDFTGMSAVLVSLIVGIAPYSFNKLSEGIKS